MAAPRRRRRREPPDGDAIPLTPVRQVRAEDGRVRHELEVDHTYTLVILEDPATGDLAFVRQRR